MLRFSSLITFVFSIMCQREFVWHYLAGSKEINQPFEQMICHHWSYAASDFDISQCWLPDCCNRWPKVQLVITSEFFFKMPLLYFFSLYSTHDITLASLRISQFLNSHLTQLSLMYFCDLTSDPWMVILSQTRIEYSLWLTSQHTGEEAVFYYTLYMYVEHGDRDVLYLLWAISSHYSLWTLITPEAFVLALRLCMYVCMYARLCVQIGLSMSMYACMCGSMCLTVCVCTYVRRMLLLHLTSLNHPADCSIDDRMHHSPRTPQNWWCCRPEIPFVALPSGITINNHDIIPFLSMGRPMLIDSTAPAV